MRTRALILQCSDDVIAPQEVGEYVHRQIPGSELILMQATGHCPNLSAPEETIAAIRSFLIFHETHYAPLLRMQGAVREIAVDLVRADGRRLPVLVSSVLKKKSWSSCTAGRSRSTASPDGGRRSRSRYG